MVEGVSWYGVEAIVPICEPQIFSLVSTDCTRSTALKVMTYYANKETFNIGTMRQDTFNRVIPKQDNLFFTQYTHV